MSEPVVLFDGACGFCRVAVTRLARSRRLRLAGRLSPCRSVDLAPYGLTARNRHRIPGPWERTCAI